jgi:two-component system NtrC family response regulator
MDKFCDRFGIESKGLSPGFWDVLHDYRWPGNVRELIQALEKALLSAKDETTLFPKHLPHHIRIQVTQDLLRKKERTPERVAPRPASLKDLPKLQEIRDTAVSEAERQYLRDLLSLTGDDIKKACQVSGLSRSRLYTLLKKYRTADSR